MTNTTGSFSPVIALCSYLDHVLLSTLGVNTLLPFPRLRRYCTSGDVKASQDVLEMYKTKDGRTLPK